MSKVLDMDFHLNLQLIQGATIGALRFDRSFSVAVSNCVDNYILI